MANLPTKIWGLATLPTELRLRILANTHLGPPLTAGYHPNLEVVRVRNGRIVPHIHLFNAEDTEARSICTSPQTHKTTKPECQCRIIPTQLFTLSLQTSSEALETFYTNLHLDLDPCTSAPFLRSLSPLSISRLRHLTFTMTPAHVEGWLNGAVASGYHPVTLESQVAIPYWGGGAPPDAAGGAYRAAWREVVSLLTAHADLPRLSLTIDMGECTWVYIEDWGMMEEEPNDEDRAIIRFIHDFYADVVTALCALRGLGALNLKLSAFQQLKPWLEREVLGRESPEPVFESALAQRRWTDLWRRPRWYQVLPRWHDGDRRLEGSNYQP